MRRLRRATRNTTGELIDDQEVLSRVDKDGVVTTTLLDSDGIEFGPWP